MDVAAGGAVAAAAPAVVKDNDEPVEDTNKATGKTHLAANARYHFDAAKLQELRDAAPWMKDPKYFQKIALSPSAVMKIMMHCHSGVEKGISQGGNPVEVMGILLGRADDKTPRTLVVTDAFPLPIEGFETRVIADDENVVNHMIALGESLERTRKEKFMGWYHSHPFDLGDHSHCFLSQTDLSTQLQWQRAEDPHGNPFVAIVVDPLRSVHYQQPELKAFRAYPPEFNSAVQGECPDGSVEHSEQLRLEHWGSCWNRYYELDVEYFMSNVSRQVLSQLTQDYLWMRPLQGQPESNLVTKLGAVSKQFQSADLGSGSTTTAGLPPVSSTYARVRAEHGTLAGPAAGGAKGVAAAKTKEDSDWDKAVQELVDVASEQLNEATLQSTKEKIFS